MGIYGFFPVAFYVDVDKNESCRVDDRLIIILRTEKKRHLSGLFSANISKKRTEMLFIFSLSYVTKDKKEFHL
jgi:hypothetical protein